MFERDRKSESGDAVTSLIDADMRITGTVVSSGDIILAGGVDGEIKCRNLFIEDEAVLTGNVNAEEAVVAGQVDGEVNVGTLRIKDTGKFDGVIRAAGIEANMSALLHHEGGPGTREPSVHLDRRRIRAGPDEVRVICQLYYEDFVALAYALPEPCRQL